MKRLEVCNWVPCYRPTSVKARSAALATRDEELLRKLQQLSPIPVQLLRPNVRARVNLNQLGRNPRAVSVAAGVRDLLSIPL